jgi:GDPmannose 4,6-dehydratase
MERIEHLRTGSSSCRATCSTRRSLVDTRSSASKPNEVYNLAAMSFVPTSWNQPVLTGEFTGVGVTRMLEAIRQIGPRRSSFYQASSSEMFGKVREVPQTETTPFYPRSPYGVAKAYGHFITVNYRESYGIHAVVRDPLQPRVAAARPGVRDPQDHERRRPYLARPGHRAAAGQPRRPPRLGLRRRLRGSDVAMLQQPTPEDYVIATGIDHSVREVCKIAFGRVGLDYEKHVVIDEPKLISCSATPRRPGRSSDGNRP